MQTRLLMMCSAVLMFVLGALLTFAPHEFLTYAGGVPQPLLALVVQVAGALYVGFAVLSWMAKDNLLGGIYSRPVAMGNLAHFLIVAIAISKFAAKAPHETRLYLVALAYVVLAVWFGLVIFGSPVRMPRASTTP